MFHVSSLIPIQPVLNALTDAWESAHDIALRAGLRPPRVMQALRFAAEVRLVEERIEARKNMNGQRYLYRKIQPKEEKDA